MDQYQLSLRRSGKTLQTDKSSRMPERPKAKLVEDLGSDFAPQYTRGTQGKKSKNLGATPRRGVKISTDLLDDESSDDELDLLSQHSRASSSSPARLHRHSRDVEERSDGILVDGEFHPYYQDIKPKTFPKFKKIKKDAPSSESGQASNSTTKASSLAAKEDTSLGVRPPPFVDPLSRPKHKVLGMRPLYNRPNTRLYTPSAREKDPDETPKSSQQGPKPRPRPFPITELADERVAGPPAPVIKSNREEQGKTEGKGKARDFPMDVTACLEDMNTRPDGENIAKEVRKRQRPEAPPRIPPLAEKSNAAQRPLPKPFPMLTSGSQNSTHSEPPSRRSPPHHSPGLSPTSKSSPPRPKEDPKQKMYRTTGPARKKSGARQKRVVSSSENPESSEDGTTRVQKKQQPKPFPMESQVMKNMDLPYSPGKRTSLDENMGQDREPKRIKDEMLADIMSTMQDEDSLLFLSPDVDPATLCPWCDEPLPPAPSPYLENLILAARKHSSFDERPTNPMGLYAAPTVFVNVCQRHRFESIQIPLASKRGWPTHIDWACLGERVRSLKSQLQRMVDDIDEDFLPGREKQSEDDQDHGDEQDAADNLELLKMRPRKGSLFWREVTMGVRKKGTRQATGVRGQMTSFSKTQPGYYGELGYVIINQTIYDLFPPAEFESDVTLPLTPTEFIQRVLVPEAAVSLIMQDLQQSRKKAIKTLRESASYGVAMFPDDHAEGMMMNAGEQIVQNRAAARRRQLEQEEREEDDLWTAFSEPPSGSELDTTASITGAGSTDAASGLKTSGSSSRPQRRCASRTHTVDSSDSESDVAMASNDNDYAPSRTRKARTTRKSGKSVAGPSTSRSRAVKNSDAESTNVAEVSGPTRPRPKPRPLKRVTDTESAGDDEIRETGLCSASTNPSTIHSVTFGANGRHRITVQREDGPSETDVDMTPRAKRTTTLNQTSSTFFPLQAARNKTASSSGDVPKVKGGQWARSLRDDISEDDMSPDV